MAYSRDKTSYYFTKVTYIEDITRWLEDMNFMFEWQEQYLTSERSERVRYCSCHSNIKFISSRHCVISSIYSRYHKNLLKLCNALSGQGATFPDFKPLLAQIC